MQNINIIELKTLQTMFNGFKYMLQYKIRKMKDRFCEQVYISYLSTQSMLIDITVIVTTIGNWTSYRKKYLYQLNGQNSMIHLKSRYTYLSHDHNLVAW